MRCLIISLLFFANVGWAQPSFQIRHLTTRDGLSQGSCFYIHKDSRGFVWISSQNGLNRFDGARFTNYRFNDTDTTSIGKGEVRGIVETPNGDLWVGTEECLSRYVRRTNSFKRYYPIDSQGRRKYALQEPFFADDSTVWYASSAEGIMKLNYRTGRKTSINPSVRPKFSIATEWIEHQPGRQTLTFLLPTGFAQYNYQTKKLSTFLTGQPGDQPVDAPARVRIAKSYKFHSIHHCRRAGLHTDHYCLVGPQGIFEFDANIFRLVRHHPLRPDSKNYRFVSMDEDSKGRWWLAAQGRGVWLYDPAGMKIVREITPGSVTQTALLTNQVSAVYIDDQDLVWVNDDPFGVAIIYPDVYTIQTMPDNPVDVTDLNNHPIRGLCEDQQGHIWIGTSDGGIRRLDPTTGLMRAYTAEQGVTSEGNVRHIIQTRNGRLLVANLLGILRYEPAQDRFVQVPNERCHDEDCRYGRGISELPDGKFIEATYGGLFVLDSELRPISRTDSGGTYFGALYFDAATNLVYAGRRDQDLVIYRYEKGQLNPLYVTLPGHNIMQITADAARGCLWLCTDRGLIRFDAKRRRTLRTYTVRDGLPDDVIYGMLVDKRGSFWLSTNNGLTKFLPSEEKFSPVVSTKGREYNSQASLIASDGTFYFGGVHGLDRFVPEKLDMYRANVPIRIVDFRVNDKPYQADGFVGETGTVALTHEQRTISIELAALDYFSNGKNQLLYQMSGIDQNWVNLADGSYTIRYPDLSPGNYTFQARAIDARGQLTPITRLTIYIRPPFWQQWWFWMLCLLMVASSVFFWVRAYNRQKLNRQRRLLQNTLATQENERQRIARDLHDDVGNTLAAAKGALELAEERKPPGVELPEVAKAYALINKAGNDLRSITHDLMPVEFEKYALPDVVAQLVERVNRTSPTRFEFIIFGHVHRLKPERELVTYRIIAELIQNALKHGGPGIAIVQVGYYERQISILVETPLHKEKESSPFSEQVSAGIGQKNITYRAEYLRATLTTDSNAESYTVMLDVPYDSTPPQSH
ncbi:two-component regulator propeller domain-containing protein [Spirosoma soli]|uniref:Two-component regulator propeller domain-containing protein n=1 Tax=Spirosoma soli TaxID=1770529 RepID=A0ABW5LYH5_9BACT